MIVSFDGSFNENKMKLSNEKKRRLPNTYIKCTIALIKLEGTIQGKDISITICPNNEENHIKFDW